MAQASKVGRNDLCSCGSGKKFKKCCESKGEPSSGATWMLILIVVIIGVGLLTAVTNFSSDTSGHVGQTSGVWDPAHGHYH